MTYFSPPFFALGDWNSPIQSPPFLEVKEVEKWLKEDRR
jgi:hypothetical protein